MRLEQIIRSTMTEAADMDGRLDQLVRAGLMPTSSLPLLKRAISRMHAGMSLQGAERDVMNMFISSMMFIVLGDDTIFNKARVGAKSYATEAKEKTEYDYEGDMAMGQLKSIIANSQRMHDMLSDDTNLPEWVQSKITLAEDYISTASNYMQGEMNEEKMPFEGPYRKVGERKDKYGNPIKNVAKHLAKKAMNAQKNEEVELDENDQWRGGTRARGYGKSKETSNRKDVGRYTSSRRDHPNDQAGGKLAAAALRREKMKEESEQIDEVLPLVAGAAARYAAGKAGAGVVGRAVAGAATKYAVSKSMKKEEVEQVDEISKATLGSYVKKASGAEQPKNVMSPKNVPLTKIAAYQGDSETGHFGKRFNQHTYDKAERLRKNRETGIKRAVDKLTKEDVEQIDELSKKTLSSYVVKSLAPSSEKSVSNLASKGGYKLGKAHDDDYTAGEKEDAKSVKRSLGVLTAVRKMTKEDVEQVDEISKKTMGRYINKAKDSIDMTSYRSGIKDGTAISSSTPYKSNNPLEKKLSKRHKGIETAVKKLTKEDIDAVKQMNESYKIAFEAALNEYGIKSPSELDESKRKEFFNHVDLEFKKGDN